ncbi:hypothetical protein [Rhizobium rhizosphaerae]|uniref:hypothetical protein n=1 Tax=Xaviernesmea rhizosphaerae TaxID=1672749 RepID=UPI0015944E33
MVRRYERCSGLSAPIKISEKQLEQGIIALPPGPTLRYAIVASHACIARHRMPETPSDLTRHNCIKRRFPGDRLVTWRFVEGDEEIDIAPEGRLAVTTAHNELQAELIGVEGVRMSSRIMPVHMCWPADWSSFSVRMVSGPAPLVSVLPQAPPPECRHASLSGAYAKL